MRARPGLRVAILTVAAVLLLGSCNGLKFFHSPDDKAITTAVQAKLFNDPVLKTRDIRVESHDGIVTLSGSVSTALEKTAVERIASQEDGVNSVVNTLSVASPSAATASEPVQTAVTATPAPPTEPPAAEPQEPAPQPVPAKKPRHKQAAQPASNGDKATQALEAYTNSVAPEPSPNPSPAQAPEPAAAAPPTVTKAAEASASAAPPPAAPTPPTPAPTPAPPAPSPAPAPKPPQQVTIPAGTVLTIRMIDNIDSSRNKPGEEFAATLDEPINVDGRDLASRGSDARVRLVDAKSAGSITGQSELQLALISVKINGVSYPTQSGYYQQHGASRSTRSAETIGGGAILGALIGGILGHGKGAAIGSIAGAGAGTAVQVSTKGQQVKVPSETKIDFTLNAPVAVNVTGNE